MLTHMCTAGPGGHDHCGWQHAHRGPNQTLQVRLHAYCMPAAHGAAPFAQGANHSSRAASCRPPGAAHPQYACAAPFTLRGRSGQPCCLHDLQACTTRRQHSNRTQRRARTHLHEAMHGHTYTHTRSLLCRRRIIMEKVLKGEPNPFQKYKASAFEDGEGGQGQGPQRSGASVLMRPGASSMSMTARPPGGACWAVAKEHWEAGAVRYTEFVGF